MTTRRITLLLAAKSTHQPHPRRHLLSTTIGRRIPQQTQHQKQQPNTTAMIRRCLSSSSSSSKGKRPPVFTSSNNSNGHNNTTTIKDVWYTPSQGVNSRTLDMGRYGLRRIDYTSNNSKLAANPPVWTLPPHPPTKSVQERVLFPLTLLIVAGLGVWAYLHPEEEDMRDYWKRVETGQILVEDDDDDDDEDDWEDDDE
jgi:hypothetical protein